MPKSRALRSLDTPYVRTASGAAYLSQGVASPGLTSTQVQDAIDLSLSAHEAEINPHPIYLTQAEGDAYYSLLGHNHDDRYYTETESDAKYALKTRLIGVSGLGLSGGGDLSADRTIALASSSNPGAAASVLATSASGALTLNNGGSTSQPAITAGDGFSGRLAIGNSGWVVDGSQLRMLGSTNFYIPAVAEAKVETASVVLGAASGSTVNFRGSVLTGTAWYIAVDGAVLFADNTNTAHLMGMAKIGYVGHSNAAGFGHRTSGATTYAFRQGGSYSSYFNAGAGQWIYFRNGDVDQAILKPEGLQFETGKYVKTNGYISGFAGSGWDIDQGITFPGETFAEFDNLSIRGTMRVYELLINQIRATNGTEIVSSVGKISSATGSTWEFEDPENSNLCPFADNDLVIIQSVDVNSTTVVKRIVRRVTSVTGKSVTTTAAAGGPADVGAVVKGDTVVRFGNSTDTSRQGVVLITSDFVNAPYIDVINGVASWADWVGSTKTKLRLGKLTGITSTANEYGLLVGNGFSNTDSFIKGGTSGVVLNRSELKSYNGASQTISLQPDGDVFFGSNVAAVATTSFAHFGAAQTYDGETMGVGDLLIGNHAAGNTFWDASAGTLNFRNGTTVEAFVTSDGVLSAGGGVVKLDSDGIAIDSPSSTIAGTLNSLTFKSAGNYVGSVYGHSSAGNSWTGLKASKVGVINELALLSISDTTHKAQFSLSAATGILTATDVTIYGEANTTSFVSIADVDHFSVGTGSNAIRFTFVYENASTAFVSEISNDLVSLDALVLAGNKGFDGSTRRVSIYDHLYVGARISVGVGGYINDSLGSFVGQAASANSCISLANTGWGNAAHIGFNAYLSDVSGSYDASGAWKFLGSQYTGNVTRPGMLTWDGNGGIFRLSFGEAGLSSGSDITTWTRLFEVYNSGVISVLGQSAGGLVGAGIALKNATTAPVSNPTGGGVLYVVSGALKYRGSSGTVTNLANA